MSCMCTHIVHNASYIVKCNHVLYIHRPLLSSNRCMFGSGCGPFHSPDYEIQSLLALVLVQISVIRNFTNFVNIRQVGVCEHTHALYFTI